MPSNKYKVFANKFTLDTVSSMITNSRLSHAFLFFGDKGLGKKNLSAYIASQIVCSDTQNAPCTKCKSCAMARAEAHPDIIWVKPSGKNGNYKVDDLRPICVDAYISPNSSEKKVYILADFDKTPDLAQNVLLKIVEEPPEFSHFIFTAQSKSSFLPTMLSRMISIGVEPVTEEQCREALIEKGYGTNARLEDAIDRFGKNIGLCQNYLDEGTVYNEVILSQRISEGILSGDEYLLLKSLSALEADRDTAKNVLRMLSEIVRDASVMKLNSKSRISCCKDIAEKLSSRLSQKKSEGIFIALTTASQKLDANAGIALTLTSLCADIKNIC